ncbi:MAG: hypothetical protein ACP5K1_00120 [Candidatus Bathyarchaeia archaeon]
MDDRLVKVFELSSISLTVILLLSGISRIQVLSLFAASTSQGLTLEYLFHRLGKYKYPMEKFMLKLPLEGYPPLSVVLGYFWFYSIPFHLSAVIAENFRLRSPALIISLMLLSALAVELAVDNLLTWIGLWHYDGRRRRIGFIPVGVASTVPAFMAVSLFLAYYSPLLSARIGLIQGLILAAAAAVLGGLAICGLRMIKGLPGWARLILPCTVTYAALNLCHLALEGLR